MVVQNQKSFKTQFERIFPILFILFIFCSNGWSQGYIDCATIITDDDFGPYNVTEAKVVNGYTYLMVSTSYGGPTNRFPVINGEQTLATGFSAETYFAIFDPECNQIKGTYISAEDGELVATDLETDAAGNAYVLSFATFTNGVATTDGTTINGDDNFVLHKYDPAGNLIYSTIYGGSDGFNEYTGKVATDGNDAYVFGASNDTDFPTTDGTTTSGNNEQYLVKYDMNGNLVYATLLGGSSADEPNDLKIVNGCAIAVGTTSSSDFPTTDGTSYQGTGDDVTLTKYDPLGNLVFSTVFGGTLIEGYFPGTQLAADGSCIVIGGATFSPDFPTTDGTTSSGGQDAYVRKYDLQGNLIFSTIIGSSGSDEVYDVVLEGGEIYVMGHYADTDFPVTVGTTTDDGVFVLNLDAAGNTIYATSYGSSRAFTSSGIFVDTDGSVILPVTTAESIATDNQALGSEGLYVAKLNPDGTLCSSNYVTGAEQRRNYNTCPSIQGDTLYLVGSVFFGTPAGVSTDGTEWDGSTEDFSVTKFVLCATPEPILVDTLSADTIMVCENGIIDKIEGMEHVIDGSQFPSIYIDGTLSNQPDIPLEYQWQVSTTGSAPWTDVSGPLGQQQDYTPAPTTIDLYYRRLTKTSDCCGGALVSTSSITCLQVVGDMAPMVETDGTFYTCPGSPVMIDATIVGGTAPFTYSWDDGAFTIEDPTVSPTQSTVYTLDVIDANGCMQSGQATVATYQADAGLDTDVCAGTGTTIGGAPLPGVTIVPSGGTPPANEYSIEYSWTPITGLSCTDCPNPTATPTSAETYTLTTTINYPDGTSCQTNDIIEVGVIDAPPTTEFAGPDTVLCFGQTALLGTAPDGVVGPYLAQAAGSTTTSGTLNVSELSDGNTSTGVKTNDGSTQQVVLDLGSVNLVNTLNLAILNSGSFDSDFRIEVSTDGINYTTLFNDVRTSSFAQTTVSASSVTPLSFPEQNVQYFRFTSESNFRDVGIGEFSAGYESYSYIWTPGTYITTDGSYATYDAGTLEMPSINPITYSVTANQGTCNFYDQVTVAVIEARANEDGCGPRLLGEADRTSGVDEVYTWTKITDPSITTGSGDFTGATDILNAPVSASTGGNVGYELTVSYTLPSGVTGVCKDTVIVPDTCPPGASCNIVVVGGGCPDFENGNPQLMAIPQDFDPSMWTFSWDSDLGMTGLDNYNSDIVTLTDNVARTYTVTMTSTVDPTYSCTASLEANSPAFSTPIINTVGGTMCKGDSINIGDPSNNPGLTYSWTNAQFLDNATINYPVAFPPSTTEFILTATDNITGCQAIDTITVFVPTAANAGPDLNVCDNGVVTLGANTDTLGFTYSWEPAGAAWEPGSGPTDAMPEVFVATTQDFYLTAVDTSGMCTTRDTVSVVVEALPPPFTLTDIDFCPSQTSLTLGTADGTAGGTNEVPSGYLYTWSPTTVSDASAQNPTINAPLPTVSATYEVTVATPGGCNQKVEQTINPIMSVPLTTSPSTVCLGESTPIGDDANEAGFDYAWTSGDTDVTATLDNAMSLNPIFTPDAAGTFTFTVTKTSTPLSCSSSAEVTITVVELTPPTLTPQTICAGETVQIGLENDPTLQYQWDPTTDLDDAFIANPTFSGTTSTDYTLTIVDGNGCTAEASTSVTVNPGPAVTIVQPDKIFCSADSTSTVFSPMASPAGNYTYAWTPSTNLDNPSIQNPTFFIPGAGSYEYVLKLTDQGSGCSILDTLNIEAIYYSPAPSVSEDQSICAGESVDLTVTTSQFSLYQWQVSTTNCTSGFTDITGADMTTYTASPAQESYYRVVVTDPLGECIDTSACVTVMVSPSPVCSITGNSTVGINAQDEPYTGTAGMTSYQWSIISGDAMIDGTSNTQNIDVDFGTMPSTIQLIIANASGCTDTCTLDVISALTCSITGPTDTCQNSTGLIFTGPASATSYSWAITTGDATISGSSTSQQVTVDAGTNNFTIELTLAPSDNSPCTQMVTVSPPPTATTASITLCDDGDGTVNFDLTSVETTVDGGASGVTVSWFSDMALMTSITTPAAYASSGGTVYAKVTNTSTNCMNSAPVTLTVNPLPTATTASITLCDDGDGTVDFDLTTVETTVDGGASGVTVSWFSDMALMTSITTPAAFASSGGTVYAKVTNTSTNCMNSVPVTLTVNPLPTATTASITLCDDGDGTVDFDLTTVETTVDGGASGVTVSWFSDMALMTSIATPAAFASSGGTVYAKVTNTSTNCMNSVPVTLTVNPLPTCSITGNTTTQSTTETYTGPAGMATYAWSVTSGDAVINGANNMQSVTIDFGTMTSTIELTITDTNGCQSTCSVTPTNGNFDLALKKEVLTPAPFQGGDDVTFEITVYNQGTIDATNIEINDYFPSGLALNDSNWDEISAQVAADTIASLAAGDSTSLFITLRIHSSYSGNLVNNAEIVAADGGIDEDAPLTNTNDGTTNELATDDNVDDDGTGTPGTSDLPGDEDDYDPALIQVECSAPKCLPVQVQVNQN